MNSDRGEDAVLDTLFLPIRHGRLAWPSGGARLGAGGDDSAVLFLRARTGGAMQGWALPGLVCEQTFKPDVDALVRAGRRVILPDEGTMPAEPGYALVLVLPPRQRDEARALLARAVMAARPGGRVLVCASNNEGARSVQADLERLAGSADLMVKNKCRVLWSGPLHGAADPVLAQAWVRLDAPRPIADGRYISRPGVFAWNRVDPASALLASLLPAGLAGHAADLGAGYGYLSAQLLERCAGITTLDVIEAERRALDLARVNLASFEARVALDFLWCDVMAGLERSYDVILTNPPFHAQRGVDRPDIGRRFVAVAAQALAGGGRLWLVANRHLPYEAELSRGFAAVRTVAQAHGFKVIEAVKARSKALRSAVS